MKEIIKKWWFWVVILLICIICYTIISSYIENKKQEKKWNAMAEGFSSYFSDIDNAESQLDKFSYNYETGKVDYKSSKITLEKYNKIEKGMTEDEVIINLGSYDNKLNGENTYTLEWGNSYSPLYDGYWVQITFNTKGNVLNKNQVGLE